MVGVGDKEAVAGAVGQHLAGEGEGRVGRRRGFEVEGAAVNHSFGVKFGDHAGEEVVKGVVGQFAFVLADDLAGGVDEHQGGPGAAGVLLPDLEFGVVDDGVFEFVALGGEEDVVGVLFVGELGGMDADDDQFGGVFLFQFPQLRK